MGFLTLLAIIAAKSSHKVIKLFGKSGGTALPGLIALKIDPNLISNLSSKIKKGSIIVSGTNGKTTTARLISSILKNSHSRIIHNRAGSNLERGIAATLAINSDFLGRSDFDFGLWELDEATLPKLLPKLNPKIIILTNLFRDQLDRYGEIDKIKTIWQKALVKLPSDCSLILNADDPAVAHLGHNLSAKVIYFGLDDPKISQEKLPRHADSKYCSYCASQLDYEHVYISHLGKYKCKVCGKKRPKLSVLADNIKLNGINGLDFRLKLDKEYQIQSHLLGIYNIYNLSAALTCAKSLNLLVPSAINILRDFKGAFGRFERVDYMDKRLFIFLVKNPTGFNEVIRTLFSDNEKKNLAIVINDNIADGRDVSWLWDVDFEKLKDKTNKILVSGVRANDMILRLKYADIKKDVIKITQEENLIDKIANSSRREDFYILPTYTALIDINKNLAKKGLTKSYWNQ